MTIAEIRQRDGDRCARCGSSGQLHVHHRVRRSQGGRDDSSNLITLCSACHNWVHANPYAAREGGWLLRPTDDPSMVPVRHKMWPAAPVWLGSDLDFVLWHEELSEIPEGDL
jgi:hypothetical protein